MALAPEPHAPARSTRALYEPCLGIPALGVPSPPLPRPQLCLVPRAELASPCCREPHCRDSDPGNGTALSPALSLCSSRWGRASRRAASEGHPDSAGCPPQRGGGGRLRALPSSGFAPLGTESLSGRGCWPCSDRWHVVFGGRFHEWMPPCTWVRKSVASGDAKVS